MSILTVRRAFLISLAVRLVNALLSSAFFQPDEYWQSLEVAHKLVFGYGYTTWEWRGSGIRSPLYPLLFTPVYAALKVAGSDDTKLLTLAPRLVQAVIAAWCDVSTHRLGVRLFGPRLGNAALFCSLTSFFNFYASTRTFSNATETALTAAALASWPWDGLEAADKHEEEKKFSATSSNQGLTTSLILAAVATVMRPSNVVIWLILGTTLLVTTGTSSLRIRIIAKVLVIGLATCLLTFLIDSFYYSSFTFTPYTFLIQNVFNSISLFYGANPFHFYLTQAIPFMTLTQLPFALHGLIANPGSRGSSRVKLAKAVVWGTIGVYSLLGHKEFRFIHPLLPLLNIFASSSLVSFYRPPPSSPSHHHLPIKTSHILFLLVSIIPGVYMTHYHASGQTAVMQYLRELPREELKSVAFLLPCHSTSWQSALHRRNLEVDEREGGSGEGGRVWFLTCEPPILGQDPKTYQDQSDIFYLSPLDYISTLFPSSVDPAFPPSSFNGSHEWPSHLVLFENLLEEEEGRVGVYLKEKGYGLREEGGRIWNSHWHEDERRRGDILVLEWKEV